MFRRGLAGSALTVLATATFLVSADRQVVAPVLPAMARDLHATIGATAGMVSAYLFSYGLFEMAYGSLADRHGRLRVMGLAMQVFGLGALLTGLMPNLPTVIALRGLTGAGAAAVFPLGLTYLGDTVALSRRQAAIGSINTASALGQAFSVALGGLVAQLASWRILFILYGAVATATAFAVRRLPESAGGGSPEPAWRSLRRVLRTPGVALLYAITFLEGGAFYGSYVYLSPELHARGYSYLAIGAILAVYGVCCMLSTQAIRLGWGRLSTAVCLRAGGAALTAAYLAVAARSGPVGALACVGLLGIAYGWFHSALQVWATQACPWARGITVSGFAFSLFVGGGVFAQVFAPLADRSAYHAMFLATALVCAVTALGAVIAFPRYCRVGDAAPGAAGLAGD